MTEAELKQVEVDSAYFHSHRDKNNDGMLDKVISFKYYRDVMLSKPRFNATF